MSDTPQVLDSPLEQAAAQLRELAQRQQSIAPAEANVLRRMLTHIVNMKRSVLSSAQDHANAAKRLGDFSLTLSKMADNLQAADHGLATRLKQLAASLSLAGRQLANGEAASSWAFSEEASV